MSGADNFKNRLAKQEAAAKAARNAYSAKLASLDTIIAKQMEMLDTEDAGIAEMLERNNLIRKVLAIVPILRELSSSDFFQFDRKVKLHAAFEQLLEGVRAFYALRSEDYEWNNNNNNSMFFHYQGVINPNDTTNNDNNNHENKNRFERRIEKETSKQKVLIDEYIRKIKDPKVMQDVIETIDEIKEREGAEWPGMAISDDFYKIVQVAERAVRAYLFWKKHATRSASASGGIARMNAAAKAADEARDRRTKEIFAEYYVKDPSEEESVYSILESGAVQRYANEGTFYGRHAIWGHERRNPISVLAFELALEESYASDKKRLSAFDFEYLTDRIHRNKVDLTQFAKSLHRAEAVNAASGSAAASMDTIRLKKLVQLMMRLLDVEMKRANKNRHSYYGPHDFELYTTEEGIRRLGAPQGSVSKSDNGGSASMSFAAVSPSRVAAAATPKGPLGAGSKGGRRKTRFIANSRRGIKSRRTFRK